MTLPEATVALDCMVTVPSVRLAPVIAVVADACVLPTTFGTVTFCAWFIPCLAFEPKLQADSTASTHAAAHQRLIVDTLRFVMEIPSVF
jgi:hypothetical protein